MRPRARTEATPIKVVHSLPPPTTTTTRMREGRRASSGVLAGRIDPGSLASRLCLRSTYRPTRTSVFHFRLSPPPRLPPPRSPFFSSSSSSSVLTHFCVCLEKAKRSLSVLATAPAPSASPWLIALPPVLRHQQRVRRRTVDETTDGSFASGLNNITRGRVVKEERGKAVLPYSIKSSPRWRPAAA